MVKKIGELINQILSFFGLAVHTINYENSMDSIEIVDNDLKTGNDVIGLIDENIDIVVDMSNNWLKDMNFLSIVDIGSNEGQFAEKFSKLFPKAKFYCFEPLKEPFSKLKEKFKDNEKFALFQFALGSSEGKIKIQRNEYSPSSSILSMRDEHKDAFDFARKEFEEEIDIRVLDSVTSDLSVKSPYLLKIDVQGYESQVIEGGVSMVKNAEIIILETSFVQLYDEAPLFDDIYGKLRKLGFEYIGSFEQLYHPANGEILQQDSIFKKIKNK